MKKVVLSICMMIKNEEKNLRRCLDSLQPLREAVSSELIIVDTGSEDNSVSIAQEYTDKIFFHQWNDNFAEMRNITIGYATGEWVFIIDADEEIVKGDELINFLKKSHSKELVGVMIAGVNISGEGDRTFPLPTVRVFRKTKDFHYSGAIHNQPHIKGKIIKVDAVLNHYGYMLNDEELMERKFQRTSKLLKNELKKDPNHVYYRFQLAVSYSMHRDHVAALMEMQRACELQLNQGGFTKEHSYLLGTLVQFYNTCEDFCDDMIDKAKLCLEIEPTYIDVWYFLAQAHMRRNELDDSYRCYEQFLILLNKFDTLDIAYNISVSLYTLGNGAQAHYNMASICKRTEKWEAFEKHIKMAFSLSPAKEILELMYVLLFQVDFSNGTFEKHREEYRELFFCEANSTAQVIFRVEELWQNATNLNRQLYSALISELRSDLYGMLNKARNRPEYLNEFAQHFFQEEVEQYPYYFSLALIALMENADLCEKFGRKLSEDLIREYMKHLDSIERNRFIEAAKKYLLEETCFSNCEFDKVRLQKNIAKYLLFSGALTEEEYEAMFERYCNLGVAFVNSLYCPQIMKEGRVFDVKNVEEAFFLYLDLACKGEPIEQVMYYRQASQIFPEMNQGILGLLKKLQLDSELVATEQENSEKKEMQELKKKLLVHIEELISQEKYQDAKKVIEEAEGILGIDLDLLALKSEVALHAQ